MIKLEPVISFSHISTDPTYRADLGLIRPVHAIQWIATGHFVGSDVLRPVRHWAACNEDSIDLEKVREDAQLEMAEALTANAIKAGTLRCLYVMPDELVHDGTTSPPKRYQLAVVQPDCFAGASVFVDHGYGEDGVSIFATQPRAGDEEEASEGLLPSGMWFMWDEVAALRPDYAKDPDPTPPEIPAASVRQPADEARQRRRPGRRAKPHGKLLGIVMKRAMNYGLADAHALPDKVLGGWLADAHDELGQPAGSADDAGRDARAIINALMEIQTPAQ